MSTLSIIMPVYNTERFIGRAIESILNQTYTDYELIIVDDASTDNSPLIIDKFTDSRIRVLRNEQNQGIVYSRNRGLKEAVGKFIAPFDSDDIAMPEKFEKQIRFLQQHPDYAFVGSWVKTIDEYDNLKKTKWKLSASTEQIPSIMLFRNYFVQSSVVVRREIIPKEGYSDGYDVVEDYKLWIDITSNYKAWNYPEYLLYYRIHPQSATNSNYDYLQKMDSKMFDYIFQSLEIKLDENLLTLLFLIKNQQSIYNIETLQNIESFLLQIIKSNEKKQIYSHSDLIRVVFDRWLKACYKARNLNFKMLWTFANSLLLLKYLKTAI